MSNWPYYINIRPKPGTSTCYPYIIASLYDGKMKFRPSTILLKYVPLKILLDALLIITTSVFFDMLPFPSVPKHVS